MTDEQIALSRRVVACRGWWWMPGMLRLRATPPSRRDHLRMDGRVPDGRDSWDYAAWRVIPDLADAATLGCLLALVREAWRCVVVTSPDSDYDDEEARQGLHVIGWRAVETVRWTIVGAGATEVEALVDALEGAP